MAADNSNAEARRALTLSAPPPPPQINKDSNGPDNPIPLSPQWLLPKPGDNKASILPGDSPFNSQHGGLRTAIKPMAGAEEFAEVDKKKDVFRPSVREMDTGRRDRWRDEERDTISSTRNNRWREVEKESGDPRRTELWIDNATRHSDARRATSERWSETNNREKHNDQRRESKWNSRWGPDDKESDSWREKWSDFGRESEGSREKGMSNSTNQTKDIERESDHGIRPWRPNSSQSRGRLEPAHNIVTSNKQGTVFSYGRGRGETNTSIFTPGRGRISSSSSVTNSNTLGMPDGSDSGRGDSILKYSRIKLLDIFRVTDFSNYRLPRLPNDLIDVPSITQAEPLEPLAFSAPTSDELAILKGIDKGDIVSSGAPQTSKEGSVGRSTNEAAPARQTWTGGSRADLPPSLDDFLDDSNDDMRTTTHKTNFVPHGALRSEGITSKKTDGAVDGEFRMQDKQPYNSSSWGSQLVGGSHALPHDLKELSSEVRSRSGAWSTLQKEQEAELRNNTVSSHFSNELHWQNNDGFLSDNRKDSDVKRHPSGVMERERDANMVINVDDTISGDKSDARRLHPCTSPEDLSLFYKDPQGLIQGPFSGSDIIGWFEAGYFGIDLLVRLAEASRDAPFMLLGDVMPHLRMKARPPPGFAVPKSIDLLDASNRENHLGPSSVYGDLGKVDHLNPGQRNRLDPAVEAENRFLESLMSGNVGSSPHNPGAISEVKQGYLPAKDVAGEMNYLLAQRISSERQRSIASHPAYLAGRDGLHVPSVPEVVPGSPAPHSKILPPKSDTHQLAQPGQHVDLLSLLQASADKPTVSSVNPAVSGWSTLPDSQILNNALHGGFNILQQTNQHMIPQSVFGIQQQRLPQQNQPSLPHLVSQLGDYPSGLLPPEKLIASGISLDPQVLALLQQQYLLNQLNMQSSAAVPDMAQISVLDKLLLLQEQQKLEKQQQQQQLMLLQQQQQLLLSKVLSDNQSQQRSSERTNAFPVDVSTVNTHHIDLRQSHGGAQMNSDDLHSQQDSQKSNYPSLSVEVSRVIESVASSETSKLHLPHQLFDQSGPPEEWHVNGNPIKGSSATGDLSQQISDLHSENVDSEGFAVANVQPAVLQASVEGTVCEKADSLAVNTDLKSSVVEQVSGGNISIKDDTSLVEPSSTKESKPGSEVKKVSEKKSKKQRNKSQAVSSQAKGSSKEGTSQTSNQNTDKEDKVGNSTEEESRMGKITPLATENSVIEEAISSDNVQKFSSKGFSGDVFGQQEWKEDGHPKVWKSASGVKIKSLLEIQEEEQRRAQSEKTISEIAVSVSQLNVATPWTGAVLGRENKTSKEVLQSGSKGQSVSTENETNDNLKSRKSQLHDVLAEEVLAKSVEVASDIPSNGHNDFPLPSQQSSANDSLAIDDDFVEAKDNKKSRKKAAKLKASGVKAPVASLETAVSPLPVEKGKISRQSQEKEVLPVPPAGPSLGDFVPWKGEQAKAMPSVAWSTESLKAQRPASLRDILMEQEKKTSSVPLPIPEPIPTIAHTNRNARGSGSWQVSGSSPAKSNAIGSSSKQKSDDDLFWGPLEQVQPDAKQSSFPSLASNSWGTRSSPQKPSAFPLTRQKSSSKKVDASSRNSEAKDFRKWCESELLRLTGSKDTSFLEFCIKQSSSEAEMLLKESLGSFDPKHEFIDKFLNYKEFLPSDVIDIAFQSQFGQDSGNRFFGFEEADGSAADANNGTEMGLEASKASGRKKGKKGKKVSPSVLGFNVVSNRIMMGEIQGIED